MKYLPLCLALLATPALAQSPAEDAIATQLGRLVMQNQALAAALNKARSDLAEAIKKCGKPCEEAPISPKPDEPKK